MILPISKFRIRAASNKELGTNFTNFQTSLEVVLRQQNYGKFQLCFLLPGVTSETCYQYIFP